MSALSNDLAQGIVPITVLLASLSGSFHCVTMCGGLMCSVGKTTRDLVHYHLARLIGYALLGCAAGWLGKAVFQDSFFKLLPWLATLFTSLTLIFLGVQLWKGQSLHLFSLPKPLNRALFRWVSQSPAGIGFFSGLLPCGWLHGFVLAASTTQSPALGALVLFLFWVGTLPALATLSWITNNTVRQVFRSDGKPFASILMISAGMITLGWKVFLWITTPGHSCHMG